VHSIEPSPSAACWWMPMGKRCTVEPLSSFGSPWVAGSQLLHQHMRLALHLLWVHSSGGPLLSDRLIEAWRSAVLLGILEISDEGQDGA